jgi:hypothetical protein
MVALDPERCAKQIWRELLACPEDGQRFPVNDRPLEFSIGKKPAGKCYWPADIVNFLFE